MAERYGAEVGRRLRSMPAPRRCEGTTRQKLPTLPSGFGLLELRRFKTTTRSSSPGVRQKGLDNMKQTSTVSSLMILGVLAIVGGYLATPRIGSGDVAQASVLESAASNQESAACEAMSWFDFVPHPIQVSCGASIPLLPISPADVNGDGILEVFKLGPNVLNAMVLEHLPLNGNGECTPPTPMTGYAIPSPVTTQRMNVQGGSLNVTTASITDFSESFAKSLRAILPSPGWPDENVVYRARIGDIGWFDCDGDGDLDLVVVLNVQSQSPFGCFCGLCWNMNPNSNSYQGAGSVAFWLENTGHQRSQNAADLDGDGFVGGGDIALLLLNWSD